MYCMKLFTSSLSHTLKHTSSISLFLPLSQPSHRRWPQASCLHHSARTPQQPYAIREEPTAAILINIDLVSTYPSGSVRNSRYCISTPTANTTHGQYRRAAVAKLTQGAAAELRDARCCYGRYLISSCNKSLSGEWSLSTVKHLAGLSLEVLSFFLFTKAVMNCCDTWRNRDYSPDSPELYCNVIKWNTTVHHTSTWTHPIQWIGFSPPCRYG